MKRSVVVYIDQERRTSKINAQNEILACVGEELNALSEKGEDWSEASHHKAIKTVVGSWEGYVLTHGFLIKPKTSQSSLYWS